MYVLSTKSWIGLLFVWRGSPLSRIWKRLITVTLVATAVTVLHEKYGYFQAGLTTTPFTLIALALGIFLGFRNNTSYDRFWEGRKLWGALVNDARSLARQVATLVDEDSEAAPGTHVLELVYFVIAYVHSLRHHLRDEKDFSDLEGLLPEQCRAMVLRHHNVPIAILHELGQRFKDLHARGKIHPLHLPVLESSLTSLTNIQGGCERIKSTPIPSSYTVLIHRLVACYVFALPFGLVHSIGGFTPEVTLLVAYAFLGLDAIGDEIEEPFGHQINDLPLSALSRMIEVNLRQTLGETDVPELHRPVDGLLR